MKIRRDSERAGDVTLLRRGSECDRPAAVSADEAGADLDALVAAVMRSHRRIQRGLWRLATRWSAPAGREAGTEAPIIET